MVIKTELARNIEGVEIFASGIHTDSSGIERTWTKADLDTIIRNSQEATDPIPLKVGHSSDAFNEKLATDLGVPVGLLTGENGNGAARLGLATNLRRDDDKLKADFKSIPDPLADLIETGQFNAVSVEIDIDDDDEPNLSAVALLGAEFPAVDSLAPLTANLSAPNSGSWITLGFQEGSVIDIEELTAEFADIQQKLEEAIRGKKGAKIFRSLATMINDKFKQMTSGSKNAAFPGQPQDDGRPSKAWWDRATTAARAYQISDPNLFAGSVWFNDDPIPRTSFDTPESSIQASVSLRGIIAAWITKASQPTQPNLEERNMTTPQIVKFVLTPEDMERIGELYIALGLPETATLDDVLAAIAALKGEEVPPEGEPNAVPVPGAEPPTAPLSAPTPQMAVLQKQVEEQAKYIKGLEHEKTITKYQSQVKNFITVTDPTALAEQLAETYENVSPEAAERLVLAYKASHVAAEEGGLLQSLGTARGKELGEQDDDNDAFHQEVEELAKEKGISFEKALNEMYKSKPAEFKEYMRRVNQTVYTNGR